VKLFITTATQITCINLEIKKILGTKDQRLLTAYIEVVTIMVTA